MTTDRAAFGRRWAIPVAALPAIFSCIYAFSLGPSPQKYVRDFEFHRGTAAERRALIEAGGGQALNALVREVRRPTFEHRTEALDLLVENHVPGTPRLLRRIAAGEREPSEHRVHARSLLDRANERDGDGAVDASSIARQ